MKFISEIRSITITRPKFIHFFICFCHLFLLHSLKLLLLFRLHFILLPLLFEGLIPLKQFVCCVLYSFQKGFSLQSVPSVDFFVFKFLDEIYETSVYKHSQVDLFTLSLHMVQKGKMLLCLFFHI